MLYVIQILAAILIGVSIGAVLGPRSPARFIGSLIAIALGLITIVSGAWIYLAAGTVIFLVAMGLPANTASSRT